MVICEGGTKSIEKDKKVDELACSAGELALRGGGSEGWSHECTDIGGGGVVRRTRLEGFEEEVEEAEGD